MGKSTPKQLLWKAFAEWIKLRDCPNGRGNCISCNKALTLPNTDSQIHAGHLWPKSVVYNSLYFHPMNVHAQCAFCNTFLEGNTLEYRKGVIRRYGEEILDELEEIKSQGMVQKLYDEDYRAMAKEYRKKSRELKKRYGIS